MPVAILVVEDQPSDLLIVKKALRGLDLSITQAATAKDALELATQQDFALVLMDVHLPDMRGSLLAERLREDERTRYLPIIFVTGERDPVELKQYESGAVDCLPKPIDPVVLRSKVHIFCELHRQKEVIHQHVRDLEQQKHQLEEAVRERERAEEALQESEVRYRTLLELSPVATLVQAEREIVYVNTAVLELLGAEDRVAMLGGSILDFFNQETRDAGREYVETLVRQGGRLAPMEAEWLRTDGRVINVQISGACILYGGVVGVQFAILDITDRKRVEQELHQLSRRDALTQVANRRAFDESLDRECRRAKRNNTSLALLMLDIDAFKKYNDTYGHQAGDEVLRRVARVLEAEAHRAGDLVCRYGGEEFAAILPETTFKGARLVAERMRQGVEALGIAHARSPAKPVVTISVGVAHAPPESPSTPDHLIEAADRALYQAKRNGRNMVHAIQF
ncbi:MAG: diguanylate cyclase [Candidatus Hydrogenedentes bacterium]|nr:diguanylate cyclase [Candidatus Hydrogenedentota bacterium]